MIDFHNYGILAKLIIYSVIVFFLIYSIYIRWIVLTITESEENTGLMYSLLNALIFGMYIGVCGFVSDSGKMWKVLGIIVLFYLVITEMGYIGIQIFINYPQPFNFLHYRYYESNSEVGILFFIFNVDVFLIIFFLSFLIEKEISD